MILLTTQIALIRTRRPQLHMKLGIVAVGLIPLMAVSGFLSEVYSQRFRTGEPDERAFFIIAIYYVIAFTALASAAIAARKSPAAHKRLILLATTIIVGAAYGRWWGTALYNVFGDGYIGTLIYTYAGTSLLLAGALAYDWVTRGRLHPVYEVAVPAILAGEIATTLIYHSPAWVRSRTSSSAAKPACTPLALRGRRIAPCSQLLLDPQQLVVLRGAVRAREAAVLICPQPSATARSAMVESSVSPDRCDMTVV